jgi:8-amino-7-oxononanoate synthase
VSDGLDRVRAALAAREAAGLRRVLRPRSSGSDVLDLASNDYLGLSADRRVTAAAAAATAEWGAGSTGSRLVTGTTELHAELEAEFADFCRAPSALVFSSGYLANLAVIAALGGRDVEIVSDAANHASLIDGCRLAGSRVTVVPHRDVAACDAALAASDRPGRLLVTDAVFSVDGDLAPLAELHAVARAHGALLVVDEAHAIGVLGPAGRGAVEAAGLAGEPDIVRTAVLSKSLGAQGGVVAGAAEVIELLISTARPFIFDTGLAPASVGAGLAALRILRAEPELAGAVRARAAALAGIVRAVGVDAAEPDAAIVRGVIGDPRRAVAITQACLDAGVRVGCFRPPSVPAGGSCIRLTARATLTERDLARAADALQQAFG